MKNFIDEMTTLDEVSSEMKKIGKIYIVSEQLEARLLADWMYRFGMKIEELKRQSKMKSHAKSIENSVNALDKAAERTKSIQMIFR